MIFMALLLLAAYQIVFFRNVRIRSEEYYVYLPAGSDANELGDFFKNNDIIHNGLSFKLLAAWMGLTPRKKGGLFAVRRGWNNFQLIKALNETPPLPSTLLEVPKVKTRNNMLRHLCKELKLDKDSLEGILQDSSFLDSLGHLNRESVYCIFIPGVYCLPEKTDEKRLVEIMYGEFLHFFNEGRLEKAEEADLEPHEVVTLASIVWSETKHYPEMPSIAGVYINRLKSNMKLEADPTLVYASGNFNVRRVYKDRKMIHPEYNTYNRKGLPPGPIHFPPPEVIDAVLDFDDHDYFYFCAKDDSSGCHTFAGTFEEHKANADRFRKYLDSKKIR